jgi:hypothetical protein
MRMLKSIARYNRYENHEDTTENAEARDMNKFLSIAPKMKFLKLVKS